MEGEQAKRSQVRSRVTCKSSVQDKVTLKSYLLTQMQTCTMTITCQQKYIRNPFKSNFIDTFREANQNALEKSVSICACVCVGRSQTSLHTFEFSVKQPAEEFLLADRVVNPRRGEQLQTTAEKHKLGSLPLFITAAKTGNLRVFVRGWLRGPCTVANLCSFTNLLAEDSPRIIANDSPELGRMG